MATDPIPPSRPDQPDAVLCFACGRDIGKTTELVIDHGRPIHPACFEKLTNRRSAMTRQDAVTQFLRERGGQVLCDACIAAALGAPTKRVHSAILKIEGAAHRHHAQCSACRKWRLVAGFPALAPS